MKKIFVKIIFVIIILSMLIGCSGEENLKITCEEQVKIAIYPSSGGLSNTYYFALTSNNELLAEFGTRVGDDLSQNQFINKSGTYVFQSEKKQLALPEVRDIINLTNEAYTTAPCIVDEMILDGWKVSILYRGKTIVYNYSNDDFPQLKNLVDKFSELSSIEVNLCEWA